MKNNVLHQLNSLVQYQHRKLSAGYDATQQRLKNKQPTLVEES